MATALQQRPDRGRAAACITAQGWGWRHAGRRRLAVSDLTLTIEPGERVLLLGASGSGKSTFLHALAGVLDPSGGHESGRLLVDGGHPTRRRGSAGLVLQEPETNVIAPRVGDDIAFGCENLRVPSDEIWPRVRDAMTAVGLDVPLDHSTTALSGGQKQRLALAGALAMRPGLLLLDEPTANLDPEGVTEVRDAVACLVADRSITLVVVEHRVDTWLDIVDRVVVLGADGGLLADGPPGEVFDRHQTSLARAGVWLPGDHVSRQLPPRSATSQTREGAALTTFDLTIGRPAQGRAIVPVVTHLDVTVPQATSTAITGCNGSGKTTLALTLAGLLRPLAGRVEVHSKLAGRRGTQPSHLSSTELLTRIGTVFQEPGHQFVTTTVRDELAVGPLALKLPAFEITARVDDLLDRLHLTALAGAHPFTLSGGEQRRLSVATVLAARPAVVVLDEPTFGQDRRTWAALVALVTGLVVGGGTVVSVTHDRAYLDAVMQHEIRLGP